MLQKVPWLSEGSLHSSISASPGHVWEIYTFLDPSQHLLCQKLQMWVQVIYFNKLAKCSDVHWSSRTVILRERMVRNFNWRIKLSLSRTHLSILILLKVGGPDVRFLSSRCTYDTFFLPSKIIKPASILFSILDPNYRK